MLGQTVADLLFGGATTPIGEIVRIANTPFRVIAIAARKGQSQSGLDYDDAVFIPVTTFARTMQRGLQKYIAGTIYLEAVSPEAVARTIEDATSLLRERHRIGPKADNDFSIRNLTEIAGAQEQGADTMTTLLASVAGVSLLVGGIGIMNIMLVSVTELTRGSACGWPWGPSRVTFYFNS